MRKLGLQTYGGIEVFIDGESDTLYANNVPLKLDRAGTIATAYDGRYILAAVMLSIGATIFWFTDIILAVFDTQTNMWKMWATKDPVTGQWIYDKNCFQSPDSGLQPNLLHIVHTNRINHVRITPPNVSWDIDFTAATQQRTVDVLGGALGPIT